MIVSSDINNFVVGDLVSVFFIEYSINADEYIEYIRIGQIELIKNNVVLVCLSRYSRQYFHVKQLVKLKKDVNDNEVWLNQHADEHGKLFFSDYQYPNEAKARQSSGDSDDSTRYVGPACFRMVEKELVK